MGWIPFKASALRYRNGQLWLAGLDQPLGVWDSYGLSQYALCAGNISEDARGRWYLNITVKVDAQPKPVLPAKAIGSVLDAGWGELRTQLQYKGNDAGSWVLHQNESYSTQECACCGALTGPKGLAGLSVRE